MTDRIDALLARNDKAAAEASANLAGALKSIRYGDSHLARFCLQIAAEKLDQIDEPRTRKSRQARGYKLIGVISKLIP